jgi:hypothetical protein
VHQCWRCPSCWLGCSCGCCCRCACGAGDEGFVVLGMELARGNVRSSKDCVVVVVGVVVVVVV